MTWLILKSVIAGFFSKCGEILVQKLKLGKRGRRSTTPEQFMMSEIRALKRDVREVKKDNLKCNRRNERCERKNATLGRKYWELRNDFNNFLLREKGNRLSRTAETGGIKLWRFLR